MQATVEDCGTLRKQVTITYDADEVKAREEQLLERYSSRVNMKGFRPGKAPKSVVKSRFGTAVKAEAQEALVEEAMRKTIEDNDLRPFGPMDSEAPELVDGIKQVVAFDVRPAVALPDVSAISLTIEDVGADEKEVQDELDQLRRRMGSYSDLDDKTELERDDVATLTGKITAGDETVRDVQDLHHIVGGYPLFGKEPDEVVELIKGKKVGDVLEFDTTLPEAFKPEEWAGKDATVSVTIQQGQRMEMAEVTDEFAKRLGAEDAAALNERITEAVKARKENALIEKQVGELMDQLIEKTDFELPPAMVGKMNEQRLEAVLASPANKDKEEKELEALKAEEAKRIEDETDKEMRRHLILDAIADEYNVQATQQDVHQQLAMAAYQSGRKPDEIAKQLQESGRIYEVMNDIRQHKALELLRSKVVEAASGDDAAEGDDKPKAKKKAAKKKKAAAKKADNEKADDSE